MKIAIMQPYLFPYIGYFQLIRAADAFGIGDDVQYIEGGWINRNRIIVNGQEYLFSFPVVKDYHTKPIKERFFHNNFQHQKKKLLKALEYNYTKAPFNKDTINIIKKVFDCTETNVSKFIENHLRVVCNYLNIDTPFIRSERWDVEDNVGKTVEQRAVKKLGQLKTQGFDHFINPIGGAELYSKEYFKKNGFKLSYLKTIETAYKQFGLDFIPNLSIIDVMMFNSPKEISIMLNNYELI